MFQVASGTFVQQSSTGNFSVVGAGFTPVAGRAALMLFLTNEIADGTGSNVSSRQGIGFATSSSQRASISNSWRPVATAITGRRHVHTAMIGCHRFDGAHVSEYVADFVSFDSDGFTGNCTTTDGVARVVTWILFGGSDITAAKAGNFIQGAGTGALTMTDPGFEPDVMFLMGIDMQGISTAINTGNSLSFGWFVNQRTSGQAANGDSFYSLAGDVTTSTRRFMTALSGYVSTNTLIQKRINLTIMLTNGILLNKITNSGAIVRFQYLAIKGLTAYTQAYNQPTSTGDNTQSSLGTTPKILFNSSINVTTQTTVQTDMRNSKGFAISPTNRMSIFAGSRSGAALVAETHEDLDSTKIMKMFSINTGVPVLNASADLKSFGVNSFTKTWDTVDGTARRIIYLALGDSRLSKGFVPQLMAGVVSTPAVAHTVLDDDGNIVRDDDGNIVTD